MPKKNKGSLVDSMPPCGVGGVVDVKTMRRHQILTQDYEELRKEADAMSANLELAKRRKLVLAAEVRFLRQRYKHLMKTKDMNGSQEHLLQAPAAKKQVKNKEKILSRKEASRLRLPPLPSSKPKKKKYSAKAAVCNANNTSPLTVVQYNDLSYCGNHATGDSFVRSSVLNENGRTYIPKAAITPYVLPILESGSKERKYGANDAAVLRHSIGAFDLNQYNIPSVEVGSLPRHAPIFDLNQVSTGDDDDLNLVEAVDDAKGSINNEKQNELKFFICRNAGGEGPTRVGKRKLSWQDPVALQV